MIKKLASFMTLFIFLASFFLPNFAKADSLESKVLINEVMTASLSSNKDEFIELVNIDNAEVDISGWTLEYINSSQTVTQIYTFPNSSIIYPGGYIVGVLAQAPASTFLQDLIPKFEYTLGGSSGMAISDVGLRLKDSNAVEQDLVYWSDNKVSPNSDTAHGMAKSYSIERTLIDGHIANSLANNIDFIVNEIPTPSVVNEQQSPDPTPSDPIDPIVVPPVDPIITDPPSVDPPSTADPPVTEIETPPDPVITPETVQLPIQINELMIDPIAPQTDANDEWIELYNPNATNVNLAGFNIYAGENSNYHHSFLPTDIILANDYFVISSKDTAIALSNSGGKVVLKNSSNQEIASVSYDTAHAGESWSKNSSGDWLWTTTDTMNQLNVFTVALPAPVKTAAALGTSTKKTASKTATTKITATTPKAATTKAKATAVKAASDSQDNIALVDAPVFVPIWVLALGGVLAVIYVGYEYRFEISNKIYQFRQYRINR